MPGAVGVIMGVVETAIGGVTLSGLATGASVLGAGLGIVGGITGNKTLQKVGIGFGIAGGAGFLANGMRGAMSVTGGIGKSGGLLSAGEDLLATSVKATANSKAADAGLKSVNWADNGMNNLTSASSFRRNANAIGSNFGFDPQIEKNFWERANTTLTQYNPMMNMLGGMGNSYMINEQYDLRREMQDKDLAFQQQEMNRRNAASQPVGFMMPPNPYVRKPLLLNQ